MPTTAGSKCGPAMPCWPGRRSPRWARPAVRPARTCISKCASTASAWTRATTWPGSDRPPRLAPVARLLRRGRGAEPGLDLPVELHRHRVAATIQRLAHRQAHPAFADAVLLHIGALHAVDADADA